MASPAAEFAGSTRLAAMSGRRRRFAPLWVYLFGLFAAGVAQGSVLTPRVHSAAFNVTVFAGLAIAVIVTITVLERSVKR